jgi:hypothetical protein
MLARTTLTLAIVWLLAACQSAPPPPLMSPFDENAGFGYHESQIDEHRYEVVYDGPRARTWLDRRNREEDAERAREVVYDFALWRAAELAQENEFPALAVEDGRTDVEVEVVDEWPYFYGFGYGHYGYGYSRHHRYGYHGFYDYVPGYRAAWLQARATLTVVFQAEAMDDSLDAAATVERLTKKYPDARVTRP